MSVYLYSHRSLLLEGSHLRESLGRIPYKSVGGNELGIDHIRALFSTEQAERGIRDILHRSQKQRFLSKIYVSDSHKGQK